MLDTALLSRIQFAFTMTAHIIYPSISIGLVTFITFLEARYLYTKNAMYLNACKFWTKIFALTFGMGVVSGIVMEFQFGTNWGGFAYQAGPLLGALFTYEVLSAFFIEAGFLGIMLFGWDKVSPGVHFISTLLVMLGTHLSAFWILSANSWMQTPTAYTINTNGQFITDSFWQVIFNPSFLPRFSHMLLSCYVSASMVIMGICSYYLYTKQHLVIARSNFKTVWVALLALIPLQMFLGHDVGRVMYEYQPMKIAAIEGIWHTGPGQPTLLFAWPNQAQERNDYSIGIPKMGSFLLTGDWNASIQGLTSVPKADRPPVFPVFWSFRIMIACGLGMLGLVYLALFVRLVKGHTEQPWLLILYMLASPLGIIGLEMGWMTAELGRQPWIIHNVLRTVDAVSRVNPLLVLTTLILLVVTYGIIFGYFYFRYLIKTIQAGPKEQHLTSQEAAFHYMHPFEDTSSHHDKDS